MLEKLPSKLGRALRGARPDEGRLAFNDPSISEVPACIRAIAKGMLMGLYERPQEPVP
jgi:hypothetical protein